MRVAKILCPECGKPAAVWDDTSQVGFRVSSHGRITVAYPVVSILCGNCGEEWDFAEVEDDEIKDAYEEFVNGD